MTPEKLAALRRLHEAATPEHQIFAVGPDGDELATDLVIGDSVYGPMLCTFDTPDIWADQGDWSREKMDAYARLIAAACNALPELLDEIERLRGALEEIAELHSDGPGDMAREVLGK